MASIHTSTNRSLAVPAILCQTSGPTAHLANTSVITLRQLTNRAPPCAWDGNAPCAARSATSERQILCFAFIIRATRYKPISKPSITFLSSLMSRQDQHRGTPQHNKNLRPATTDTVPPASSQDVAARSCCDANDATTGERSATCVRGRSTLHAGRCSRSAVLSSA